MDDNNALLGDAEAGIVVVVAADESQKKLT